MDEYHLRQVVADLSRCEYFRVLEKDGQIVGWIAAAANPVYLYNITPTLVVLSYQCVLKAKSAVMALIDVHEDVHEFASTRCYEVVVTSSVMANSTVFERILTQEGWLKRGNILLRQTRHYTGRNDVKRPLTIA
jgi:hypothetical protein